MDPLETITSYNQYACYNILNGQRLPDLLNQLIERINELISGAGGASDRIYTAGSGCWVRADGEGITASVMPGLLEIAVPDEVLLKAFHFVGDAGDLAAGELRVVISGGKGSGVAYNTSDANAWYPAITVQNRTVLLPSDHYLQRPDDAIDSVNIYHERFSVPGQAGVKITGLSGDFGIMGKM